VDLAGGGLSVSAARELADRRASNTMTTAPPSAATASATSAQPTSSEPCIRARAAA